MQARFTIKVKGTQFWTNPEMGPYFGFWGPGVPEPYHKPGVQKGKRLFFLTQPRSDVGLLGIYLASFVPK